jgi:hypothetical protein
MGMIADIIARQGLGTLFTLVGGNPARVIRSIGD